MDCSFGHGPCVAATVFCDISKDRLPTIGHAMTDDARIVEVDGGLWLVIGDDGDDG